MIILFTKFIATFNFVIASYLHVTAVYTNVRNSSVAERSKAHFKGTLIGDIPGSDPGKRND